MIVYITTFNRFDDPLNLKNKETTLLLSLPLAIPWSLGGASHLGDANHAHEVHERHFAVRGHNKLAF